MGVAAPPGREHEFQALLDVAAEAKAGRGAVVLLSAPSGRGKSHLLDTFQSALADPEADGGIELEKVRCFANTSQNNPLGPFGEVMRALIDPKRQARMKRIKKLVEEVAPHLVAMIPVIGNALSEGVRLTTKAFSDPDTESKKLAADIAAALLHIAADKPLVIAIEDAQWIDADSLEVVSRIIDAPRKAAALVLVLAYDTDFLDENEAFARVVRNAVTRPGCVRRIELEELSLEGVEAVIRDRYEGLVDGGLAGWLHDLTDGDPRFLKNFLVSLDEQGVFRQDGDGWTVDGTVDGEPGNWRLTGALAAAHAPDTLDELLRPRIDGLDENDLALLESGAVQGRRFLTKVIASLLDRDHRELTRRLRMIGDERGMVAVDNVRDWWTKQSALFSFDPGVLEKLLNERRAYNELFEDHAAVAAALEAMIAEDDPPPRHALLEIARHYEAAEEPRKAAERYVQVAKSTYADGAYRETARLATRAVDLLRDVPPNGLDGPDGQALLAWALLLVLLGGETSWRAAAATSKGDDVIALAEQATEAADRSGDATLRANARYARGVVLTAYRGLDDAVAAYEDALAVAQEAGDRIDEFAILLRLGHQLDSVNLKRGRDTLERARELLASGALDGELDGDRRVVEEARLDMSIGVADFDLGRFGDAYDSLVRSCDVFRGRGRCDDLAWSLAFLAQLHTAIGSYEQAEQTLQAGLAVFDGRGEALGIRGYLHALLGHLYHEWERPADAIEHVAAGRNEANESGFRGVIPLVDAYWAEVLLADGSPKALRDARETLEGLDPFGWPRSQIARASLLGRLALAEGHAADGVAPSAEAVAKLKECGWFVTATRGEEILFAHARILAAAGRDDAQEFFELAQDMVNRKAETLRDPEHRRAYLERVPLSRDILNAPA
jgi:tetratricopeptide (TPR) repeat protein